MPDKKETQFELTPGVDPYRTLEISRNAEEADIKRAYFQQVRKFPPEQEPEQFQKIRRAYEMVRDPQQRALTDLFLLQTPPVRPRRRLPTRDLDVHVEDLIALAAVLSARPMENDVRPFESLT